MNQAELKAKKREILTKVEYLQNSVGNPSVIYPSREAQQAAIKELNELISEYQSMPRTEVLVANLAMGIAFSLNDGAGRYSLRYNGVGRWDFYEGSIYKSSDVEFSDDYSTAKVKVCTVNSDTQGEETDYVYNITVAPVRDSMITKLLNVKQTVTPQESKPAQSKKLPEDYSLTGFGFIKTSDGRLMPKTLYDAEQAEIAAKETKETKKTKRRGIF